MRILIFLFCSFLVFQSFALDITTEWTMESKKYLHISCQSEDYVCQEFCLGGQKCKMQEKVCKNCVGTSISMTYAFEEMGRNIVAGDKLDDYFIFDLMRTREFVTLTSRSIYNLVERFDSMTLRARFRSLCADGTRYPVVFLNTTESGELGQAKAVWCDSGVYEVFYLSGASAGPDLF